jgi:hypothetical protein
MDKHSSAPTKLLVAVIGLGYALFVSTLLVNLI